MRTAKRPAKSSAHVLRTIRVYNKTIPVIQNFNIGHTDPQIAMPYGREVPVDAASQKSSRNFEQQKKPIGHFIEFVKK